MDARPSTAAYLHHLESVIKERNVQTLGPDFEPHSFRFLSQPAPQTSTLPQQPPTLDPAAPENSLAIQHEEWLSNRIHDLQNYFLRYDGNDLGLSTHIRIILLLYQKDYDSLQRIKYAQWLRQRQLDLETERVDPSPYFDPPFLHMEGYVIVWYILVLSLHLLSGVSRNVCRFVLSALKLAHDVANPAHSASTSNNPRIPTTIETIIERVNILPKSQSFVCCPRCFHLCDTNDYPATCGNVEVPHGAICGEKLRQPNCNPGRLYVMNDFKDWLCRLYTRPGIEELLDQSVVTGGEPKQVMEDIWDGPVFTNFLGPDGKRFASKPGRLLFSLNMDGFNPFGNKQNGKKASIGAIYMTCLNLPPDIRNRMENIYLVGVIPGPKEPTKTRINHILAPLVDVLLEMWYKGIYLCRTPRHAEGRRILAAVIPLVCDLLASKKMSAFAGLKSHNFCSWCHLKLHDILNLDAASWKRREWGVHLSAATKWRDATTEAEQEAIFQEHGLRWSELLRLPYWDPTSYVAIDSMHCLLLGLFHRHAIHIWGMDASLADGDGATFNRLIELPPSQVLAEARSLYHLGDFETLKGYKRKTLAHLCSDLGLRYGGTTKAALIAELRKGREENVAVEDSLKEAEPEAHVYIQPLDPKFDKRWVELPPSKLKRKNKAILLELLQNQGVTLPEGVSSKTIAEEVDKMIQILDIGSTAKRRFILNQIVRQEEAEANLLRNLPHYPATSDDASPNTQTSPGNEPLGLLAPPAGKSAGTKQKGKEKGKTRSQLKKTAVLGAETITAIKKDMSQLLLPTWVSKGPAHPGEARGGKLHADQWQSFFMINLPITLTRLWGGAEDNRKRRMLQNFLYLVKAVKIGTMRAISEEDITSYEQNMFMYLQTLVELYPGVHLVPNHHIALHFGECLRRFGPTHAWRCFAFERYNYLLQKSVTNSIFGQLELTMSKKFCMLQNLRALCDRSILPTNVQPLISAYNRFFESDVRGTLMSEDLGIHQEEDQCITSPLSRQTLDLLRVCIQAREHRTVVDLPVVAAHRQSIRKGPIYKTYCISENDSQIMYRPHGSPEGWRIATLTHIFDYSYRITEGISVTKTYCQISPNQPAKIDESFTPWPFQNNQEFIAVHGKLFRRRGSMPEVLPFDEVVGHVAVATTNYVDDVGQALIQAIPLMKQ